MSKNCNRREFLRTTGIAAGALALPGAPRTLPAAQQKKPNILFLFTDDQRFSTLNAINNPEVKTPTMDKLVARGVAFTRTFIMGGTIPAVCAPSRAMLMTGQTLFHVHDNIIAPNKAPAGRRRPFVMWPEMLRKEGYETFGTGKWHNGEETFARSFSRGENIFFGGMSDHLKVPVSDFDAAGKYPKEKRYIAKKFSSQLFSDSAIKFLKEQKGDKPFCAYVAFTSPHDPRMAPKEFTAMYSPEKIKLPENFLPEHPFDNGELKIRDEMLAPFPRTPQVVKENIAGYYAMITEVDHHMGRVLKALEESPHAGNTIVVFAADNGLAVGQHGLLGKQSLYDHSMRVPMVIGGPGLPKGKRTDAMCYLLDFFPTLCELTGIPIPRTVEGKSLMPAIRDQQARLRDSVLLVYKDIQRAVRTDRWKLIRYHVNGKQTTQLFDLQTDPLEMKNLADQPGQAARVKELSALLKRWMKETDDPLADTGKFA